MHVALRWFRGKKIIIISLLALLVLISALYVFVRSRKQETKSNLDKIAEDTSAEVARRDKHDSISQALQKDDFAGAAKTAYDLASDQKTNIKMRLDSYRVCIQAAEKSSNESLKNNCYNEGKQATKELNDQEGERFWVDYLDKVYNNQSQSSSEGGDETDNPE